MMPTSRSDGEPSYRRDFPDFTLHDSLNASAGLIDGFAGDLVTIYRRFRQNYAQQDDAQAAAARALEKYSSEAASSQDPDERRTSIARRQSERSVAVTEEHGASAGAIGTPSDDGAGKTAEWRSAGSKA
jgi:hypothetical protein